MNLFDIRMHFLKIQTLKQSHSLGGPSVVGFYMQEFLVRVVPK